MKKVIGRWKVLAAALAVFVLTAAAGMGVYASSDDNSLYDLGITTEGVTVAPAGR